MIIFQCAHCGAPLRVPPERAGGTARCPRCGQPIEVPQFGEDSEPSSRSQKTPRPTSRSGVGAAGRTTPEKADDNDLSFLAPPQSGEELGRLGSYRVLKILGSGGMGIVLLAEDTKLRRQVALKVMKKSQSLNPLHRDRFLREAQAAAAIDHDHIVPIYQVDEDRGMPFLAMKLLVGESLEDRLKRETTLPQEQIIRIGMEVAEGLAAAHERGLIHRDIKPANIWLEEGRDRVRIVDFGLAQSRDEDVKLTAENFLVGTPLYMSPEQASGDIPLDHRTDLFSLGTVMYRMATGKLPFKGRTTLNVLTALATKQPKTPRQRNPAISRALSGLIMQLLQKDPAARPKTARVVIAALNDIRNAPAEEEEEVVEDVDVEEDDEVVEVEPEPPRPKRPPVRRRPSQRETDAARLERKVIRFAIFAGVCVFLLLAFLVVKNLFFKKQVEEEPPPRPPSTTSLRGAPPGADAPGSPAAVS